VLTRQPSSAGKNQLGEAAIKGRSGRIVPVDALQNGCFWCRNGVGLPGDKRAFSRKLFAVDLKRASRAEFYFAGIDSIAPVNENPAAYQRVGRDGYGAPLTFSFHSAACSGFGLAFTAFGTLADCDGVVERVAVG